MSRLSNIPEGTRVRAPNEKFDGEMQDGVIVDNLSVMYYIKFDNGTNDYVYKAQDVRLIEE